MRETIAAVETRPLVLGVVERKRKGGRAVVTANGYTYAHERTGRWGVVWGGGRAGDPYRACTPYRSARS